MPAFSASAFPAVLFVDHAKVGVSPGSIDAADRFAVDANAERLRHELESELLLHHFERLILRSVVDDQDLELGIVQLQQRLDRVDDRRPSLWAGTISVIGISRPE